MITIDRRKGKIKILKLKLKNTDYKTLKYTEGKLTAEEFEASNAQRQAWRDEINRLENLTEEEARAEGLIVDIDK